MPADNYVRVAVEINIAGSSIGKTPFYLDFSVDLPKPIERNADFLWMDNGVWLGDEPRGVRVLDTPGVHRISVLVITKNNREYRGTATVHVLEREPAAVRSSGR